MTLTLDRVAAGPVELVDRDTISGLVVPWGREAEVYDELPGGRTDHYIESFDRGAFDEQTTSPNRGTLAKIEMVETHTGGLGKVGYALAFEDRDDGQHGLFRVLPRHRDDVRQMIDDGIDGLSVRFIPKRGGTRVASIADGIERRIRTAAHMVHVALVAEPAYDTARVLAMREAEDLRLAELHGRRRDVEADELLAAMDASSDRWGHLLRS